MLIYLYLVSYHLTEYLYKDVNQPDNTGESLNINDGNLPEGCMSASVTWMKWIKGFEWNYIYYI